MTQCLEKEMATIQPNTIGPNVIDVSSNKDGGVLKEIIREGEGDENPLSGDKVFVHYVGTLAEDGSQFDSSRDRGERFEFTIGKGEVIKAWDQAVATMRKGELAKITCTAEYGYGDKGSPPKIPPNATLVFEVELFEWRGEDLSSKKDGGIIRRNQLPGEGYQTPNDGALVEVSLRGKLNGTVFDERELKFPLGEGTEHNIPEGLERALERFKTGEKSVIKLAPKYGFGSAGNKSLGVPPGASLEYIVEMKSFEKAKESWEMDQEEKIEAAKVCKERGTTFFKQEKYRLAVKQYKKIVDLLQYDSGLDDEKKKESHSVLLAGNLNLAMSYIKINDFTHAREHAAKALEMDPNNMKALFRRGQALLQLDEAHLAKKDFLVCLEIDSNNKAAANQIKLCDIKIKHDKEKERKLYSGMFEKFAKTDAEKVNADRKKYKDVMAGNLGEWGKLEKKENTEDKIENEDKKENEEKKDIGKIDVDMHDIEGLEMI